VNIGKAAHACGVPPKMIRYYESIGLIATPHRSEGGYRVYTENDVNALRFLHRARDLGFSIDQIRNLLALWRDRSRASAEVKAIALRHVQALEEKAQSLTSMSRALLYLAEHCRGDDRPDCPIIEEFSKPIVTSPGITSRRIA
jgi:MerR family copper efflux transcriptional regulator